MKIHFKKRHTNDTKETCSYCGVIFKCLKKHLERTGCGGEVKLQQFPCSRCNKIFTRIEELKMHDKRIHQKIKDRICPKCPYATYSPYNLKLHTTKMHVGEKLEKENCPHCDKVTTNLNYHLDIMHNEHFLAKTPI